MSRFIKLLVFSIVIVWSATFFGNDVLRLFESKTASISHGTPAGGSLENGKRLPTRGRNFTTYSRLGATLGRTAVHDKVRTAILASFDELHRTHPELTYVIGETGWVGGGAFPPHKTHQNGLSVDFMVPVRSKQGQVKVLPTTVFNKFGYDIEFDERGHYKNYDIDYEAIALHLLALDAAAKEHGISINRVIFDPELQPYLFEGNWGQEARKRLKFSTRRSWVRHDEHYHVDFSLN